MQHVGVRGRQAGGLGHQSSGIGVFAILVRPLRLSYLNGVGGSRQYGGLLGYCYPIKISVT
jgi:hypothetical protein